MKGDSTASSAPNPSPTVPKKPSGVLSPTAVTMEGSSAASSVPGVSSPTIPLAPTASSPTAAGMSPVAAPSSSYSSTPIPFPSRNTAPPVWKKPTFDNNETTLPSSSMSPPMGGQTFFSPLRIMVIGGIVGVATLLIFWKFCKVWKLRREKQRLRLQSTRVDMVLGDMQMVGMDEYDGDDPELI
eukprot:CAMPEP_0168234720 /NCGR_PEP_ID=MMETSP0140_2-20121125/18424_1 /TAXON_ID=44445 /ORGANISM="Pseudo-nitzschia australis, Strain 10249 10 AB" /LENGTH=183 /DNA_ID=CAMNT_0008167547 /DNA_START=205 /DNA_END=756 /DNA_ORIENTATION=-